MLTIAIDLPLPPDEALALARSALGADGVRAEPAREGTRLVVERPAPDEEPRELIDWLAQELVAAASSERAGDWQTDRRARRPTGERARETYAEPLYHLPNFALLLETLALGPEDELLEVGCGGGALLRRALATGCGAAAIDHSREMVALTREQNAAAVADGRLELVVGDAHELPFASGRFTAAVSTGVFGFLADPELVLREIRRTLREGGRLAVFGGTKELRGTPAAPEPVASRITWYEDDELAALARAAGFRAVEVTRPSLERYAREAGIPAEDLVLFSDRGPRASQLLVAAR